MSCPDPEDLARYAEGTLSDRDAIAAHLDGCASCREVVVTLMRTSGPTLTGDRVAAAISDDGERPKRGDVIGRYVVLDARGAGGMGLVLSAHDEQLDRKVALKLVRPDIEERGGAEKTRARLLREAQLMARVRHPNVVTVYDVGTLGERIFIAMELIDGVTLRDWLKEKPRPIDEVLSVFLQAGRGLAAAHSAGIVHRDFKPDNVLIDTSGMAHVTDFGIAWSHVLPPTPDAETAPLAPEVATGLKGTPAYMAPEQVRGAATDARGDQFAFCVALYEALVGDRPFAGFDRGELGAIPKSLPPHIERGLRRGLSIDPNRRFFDMNALLAELAPRPKRVLWLSVAAVAVAVVAAVAGTFALTRRASDCESGPARLKGVWDLERRAEIERAFAATGASYASTSFDSAAAALDRRTAEWLEAFRRSCLEAPSEDVRSRQRVCLDVRLGELRALSDLFARADAQAVERAPEAAARVRGPERCLTREAPSVLPLPDDSKRRAEIAQVRIKLVEVDALQNAGQVKQAVEAGRRAVELAKATRYPPLEADAWLKLVEPLRGVAEREAAIAALDEASVAAEAGHDFESQLLIAVKHVRVGDSSQPAEADRWIRRAETALAQTPDADIQAQLDLAVSSFRLAQRKTTDAVARSTAARKYFVGRHLEPQALTAWQLAGLALRAQGDATGARRELEAVLPHYEKVFGPTHPSTLHLRINIAEAARDLGQADDALKWLDDPAFDVPGRLTTSWLSLRAVVKGDALRMLGRWDDALAAHRFAVDAYEGSLNQARSAASARLHLAATLREMERLTEAEEELTPALEVLERLGTPVSLGPLEASVELVRLRLAQGRAAEADGIMGPVGKRLRELLEDRGAPERFDALLAAADAAAAVRDFERSGRIASEAVEVGANGPVGAARALLRRGLAARSNDDLAAAFRALHERGVFPLEQLAAAEAVGCDPLQLPRLPANAAKLLARRCPK